MELYPFQKKALDSLYADPRKHFIIAGVGTGKGSISLHWAKAQNKPNVLVVSTASKRDAGDFEKEADDWFPSWRKSLSSFSVISWQALGKWWKANRKFIKDYAIIFDEVACAKAGISSQRGTAFLKIALNTDCWTGYTATPGDCWMDFYAYYHATGRVTGKTAFKARFCNIQTYKGFPEIIGYRETDTLKKWWKEISLTVDSSEVDKQLPAENYKNIIFDPPKGYKEVLKTRISPEGEFLDTSGGLCACLRRMCLTPTKQRYIAEFVENLGDRIILFYNFIKEGEQLEQIVKKVLPKGAKVWRIDGKSHDIPTEQTCGKRDVILIQWQAGSMGLNLQFINYWMSVSPNYSWTITTQAKGRIRRIGQKKPMFFYSLMCKDSIETDVYKCLSNKQEFVESSWLEQKGIK